MDANPRLTLLVVASLLLTALWPTLVAAGDLLYITRPEQRHIEVSDPADLPSAQIPAMPPPRTVADLRPQIEQYLLSLDEALRVALANSEVVRVLAGLSAVSSGRTIYDTAIVNTQIDEAQAPFDPRLEVDNTFNQVEPPLAVFDPADPTRALIVGTQTENYGLDAGLAKRTITGAELGLDVANDTSRFSPGAFPLNPQDDYSAALRMTQPLLQGGGAAANIAPIVIARIETERSYFQFKDSVQELIRGVVEAYWGLVFARTDVWARRQQVDQSRFAVERALARQQAGFADAAEVAQTRVALANFRAALIAAEANQLDAEAVLRNLLGLPPEDYRQLVPTTTPYGQRLAFDWPMILNLASERRPDLVELKLIIEADQERLIIAKNDALPRLDAVGQYRWNGLDGRMINREPITTQGGEFADWTLGVNFSVPLGLRQGRAVMRRQELVVERDRANLVQGLHFASHALATNLRFQVNAYEQYLAFRETREAAQINLEQQFEEYRAGRVIFLNVLEAISDWGNAVTSEAAALTDYNTALAGLENETGTILETHGIRFVEERFHSVGPLGIFGCLAMYPEALPPTENAPRYPASSQPAEQSFDLQNPVSDVPQYDLPPLPQDLPPLEPLPPPRSATPQALEATPMSAPAPLIERLPPAPSVGYQQEY